MSWDPRHAGLSLDFYRADQSRFVNRGTIQSPDNPSLHSASVTGEGWFKFDDNAGESLPRGATVSSNLLAMVSAMGWDGSIQSCRLNQSLLPAVN